jgi:arylsulfatase A-like enzyme
MALRGHGAIRVARAMLLAVVLLGCNARTDAVERPSFVIVLSDDQRFDALGAVQREQGQGARFPWLATPNLDRLAAEGARFRNAFVVSSICSPSRASFLTGLYGHANGVIDNRTPLAPSTDTLASWLREAGYRTGQVGKWHMGDQVERPGFEWSASYIGQGRYFDCTFLVDGVPEPTQGWVDDVATDYALEFLRRQRSEPFLLVVGYKSPHGPHRPESVPERARGRHRDLPLEPAPNALALPPYTAPQPRGGDAGSEDSARSYFDLVSAMDDAFGRLLDAIDAPGLRERTVVIFAGDNGYLLGEHGMRTKRAAYEASIRIPLLVRWPVRMGIPQGLRVDAPVLNVDLAPTLLELAGVPAPLPLHGRSLGELVEGRGPPWRSAFLYEFFREPSFEVPTQLALRAPDAKLIVYPGHPEWTELFDLASDPGEQRNLARDPKHTPQLEALRAELEREASAVGLDSTQLAP